MSKELVEIVRCKNCIHRPIKGEDTHDINPPQNSRGYKDYICPCLNEDDYWYSWYPPDEWFCANEKAKGEEKMKDDETLVELSEDEDEWYQKWYRCLGCGCAFMADNPKYCPGCGKKIVGYKEGDEDES